MRLLLEKVQQPGGPSAHLRGGGSRALAAGCLHQEEEAGSSWQRLGPVQAGRSGRGPGSRHSLPSVLSGVPKGAGETLGSFPSAPLACLPKTVKGKVAKQGLGVASSKTDSRSSPWTVSSLFQTVASWGFHKTTMWPPGTGCSC